MNITHAVSEKVVGCKLEAIFNRQKELMAKYHDIEMKSGLMQTEDCPVNLHDKRGQARLKDFAWRFTEELAEAFDSKFKTLDGDEHFQEELIDSLHFLTELTILSGLEPSDLLNCDTEGKDKLDLLFHIGTDISELRSFTSSNAEAIKPLATEIIMELGMACNCLKNKPWKQSHMLTDERAFKCRIVGTWHKFIALLHTVGLSPQSTCDIYLKKSQVNKFRQRSNY